MKGMATMKKIFILILVFLLILLVHPEVTYAKSMSAVSSIERAAEHPIVSKRPAVDFFEGAILGNGGLGAIVTTRPDAVEIYFGHNDVWDIRIAENNREEIGTFKEVF